MYNGTIDRRPGAIVRCADVADVITAVNFARNEDVAVRGGGHNGAGLGVCDRGLVIDLSSMKGVLVNPTIRAEAGCTQADLSQVAHDFGLAVPAKFQIMESQRRTPLLRQPAEGTASSVEQLA